MSTSSVSNTIPGAGETGMNRQKKNLCSYSILMLSMTFTYRNWLLTPHEGIRSTYRTRKAVDWLSSQDNSRGVETEPES